MALIMLFAIVPFYLPTVFALVGTSEVIGQYRLQENSLWPGPPIAHLNSTLAALQVTVRLADRVMCVVDGRAVLEAALVPDHLDLWTCDLSFLSYGGMHYVAAYGVHARGAPYLLGKPRLLFLTRPAGASDEAARIQLQHSDATLRAATPNTTAVVGVYYTTYSHVLAQLYQNVTRMLGRTYTMEHVLQNQSLSFTDSIWGPGPAAASPGWLNYSHTCDIMHQEPSLGMYCLYRKRANESFGPMPDCPETTSVLQAHASELSAAGFEFVAPDATNWDSDPRNESNDSPGSDFYQLRPMEIIAEEWAATRLAGQATPQLSVFAQVNLNGVLYQWYLDEIFNNDTLLGLDLVFRNRNTSRVPGIDKVFIVADEGIETNYAAIGAIQNNSGRGDVATPLMWFAPNASGAWEQSGRLAYFSRCTAVHEDTNVLDFSTDAMIEPGVPCAHRKTSASPVGASWTVSTGLSINSVPFGAVRFNGLLLKKQWWDVFADPNPTDFLFAPSWNEFGSRAYNLTSLVGTNNPAFYAAGASADDARRFSLFEDGFGAQRSRSIEPSIQDGGRYYETFASCLRVYRLQASLGIVSNGTGCDVVGEECCTVSEDEVFTHVWSLDLPSSSTSVTTARDVVIDSILTSDQGEFASLQARGWKQLCVPTIFGRGPTATCVNASLPFAGAEGIDEASRGPFILFSNTSTSIPGALPLVRCVDPGTSLHLVVNSTEGCTEQQGMQPDGVLGFGKAGRDSLTARSLRRCLSSSTPQRWYTAVNVPCLEGDTDEGVLMYVV